MHCSNLLGNVDVYKEVNGYLYLGFFPTRPLEMICFELRSDPIVKFLEVKRLQYSAGRARVTKCSWHRLHQSRSSINTFFHLANHHPLSLPPASLVLSQAMYLHPKIGHPGAYFALSYSLCPHIYDIQLLERPNIVFVMIPITISIILICRQ